ncbi:hypothetical protein [Mycolicibacterium frederiksbergense]|uniref:hypothetical protein n=1 Tax=Mycolicibacterium frederiksbergense TaxID=117567 RepID=UPI00265C9D3B|nr:hypothetical protein [Mycolicibacterium frederiksbergense]
MPAAPLDSALGAGADKAGDGYRRTWGTVTGLDAQTNGNSAAADTAGQNGRGSATGVRQNAASTAAAIAPATGTPAGVKTLVTSMDDRLAAMQREINTTKAQNQLLSNRLRQVAMAYRSAASNAPAGMFRGMQSGRRLAGAERPAPALLGRPRGRPVQRGPRYRRSVRRLVPA